MLASCVLNKIIGDFNAGAQKSGVMIPIPQYPLYSATLAEYGMEQVRAGPQCNISEYKKCL
jgi:hypothetical protein